MSIQPGLMLRSAATVPVGPGSRPPDWLPPQPYAASPTGFSPNPCHPPHAAPDGHPLRPCCLLALDASRPMCSAFGKGASTYWDWPPSRCGGTTMRRADRSVPFSWVTPSAGGEVAHLVGGVAAAGVSHQD